MRPITVSAGPLVAAAATGVGLSQKAAGAQYLVLDGSKSDASATAICASQSPAGAADMTINGSLATGGVAYYRTIGGRQVYVTSAGNDSGITFTVYGTLISAGGSGGNGFMYQQETVTGANTSRVCTTKYFSTVTRVAASGASAAGVTVGFNGVGTLDVQRRVILTSGGDDTGITFVLSGTNGQSIAISETITGVNGAAASSVLDYKTVTGVLTSGAVATTVTVGTNGVAGSDWVPFDSYASMAPVSIQCTVTGTANYTVQQTLQDPGSPTNPVAYASISWVNHPDSALVATASTAQGNYAYPPVWARVVLNSETGTGSVSAVFRQAYTY